MSQPPAPQRRRPSTLPRRAAARLLDLAIVVALAVLLARRLTPLFRPRSWEDTSEVRFVLTLFGIPLLAMVYEATLVAWRGQTLGKLATGVRVQRLDGTRPGFARSILRVLPWLLSLVPVVVVPLSSLAYLWALFDRDERGLHDLLAGTQVVRAKPAPPLGPHG